MSESEATVIVVDDDSSVRYSVSRLVRAAGYNAVMFASPTEFLEQPLPPGPACVVLDFAMDGLNGLEVQRALAGAVSPFSGVHTVGYSGATRYP